MLSSWVKKNWFLLLGILLVTFVYSVPVIMLYRDNKRLKHKYLEKVIHVEQLEHMLELHREKDIAQEEVINNLDMLKNIKSDTVELLLEENKILRKRLDMPQR